MILDRFRSGSGGCFNYNFDLKYSWERMITKGEDT